jgi:hypothetical protein
MNMPNFSWSKCCIAFAVAGSVWAIAAGRNNIAHSTAINEHLMVVVISVLSQAQKHPDYHCGGGRFSSAPVGSGTGGVSGLIGETKPILGLG